MKLQLQGALVKCCAFRVTHYAITSSLNHGRSTCNPSVPTLPLRGSVSATFPAALFSFGIDAMRPRPPAHLARTADSPSSILGSHHSPAAVSEARQPSTCSAKG